MQLSKVEHIVGRARYKSPNFSSLLVVEHEHRFSAHRLKDCRLEYEDYSMHASDSETGMAKWLGRMRAQHVQIGSNKLKIDPVY